MAKLHALFTAALVGGVAGGALVWFLGRTAPPSTITVKLDTMSSEKPQDGSATHHIPVNRRTITDSHYRQKQSPTALLARGTQSTPKVEPRATRFGTNGDLHIPEPQIPHERSIAGVQSVTLLSNQQKVALLVPTDASDALSTPDPERINTALSYALEAADPYVKEGFSVREDYWGGVLPVKHTKAIVHQLFKGNEYWFWMGTDQPKAKVSVHVYDSEGDLAAVEAFQMEKKGGAVAGAHVFPKKTQSYYLIVEVEKSPDELTYWALVYGFR